VVYPVLSTRWAAGERESINRALRRWTWSAGLPAGVLMFLCIFLLPILIPQVFGSSYNSMMLGTQAMLVGTALSTVFFWLPTFLYASGRIDVWTKAQGLYTVCGIGLGWFCIQWYGFSGLAILLGLGKVCLTVSLAVIFLTLGKRVQ